MHDVFEPRTEKVACEMFISGFRPRLEKVTCSSSLMLIYAKGQYRFTNETERKHEEICFFLTSELLSSPDGGHSIRWLTSFPSNSTIVVFTSSPFDGLFAFLTHDREVLT